MAVRHVVSATDLDPQALRRIVARSCAFATGEADGRGVLEGKVVGVFFRKSSTRTRTSFTVGALKLDAKTVAFGPEDLQLATGETIEDTARVLSGYLDALVIRTNEPEAEMRALCDLQDDMAVINAMSAEEHPTQALADLSTLLESFGRLEGLHVLYVGEGNNSAASLALSIAQIDGMKLTALTPEGYGLSPAILAAADRLAERCGGAVEHFHDLDRLPAGVDAVYATRWQTMGVPKKDPDWMDKFKPYCVTSEMMARVSRPSGTVFLHDLPAVREVDVTSEVLDGPQSLAWRQARHKMYSAMAVLEWCLSG